MRSLLLLTGIIVGCPSAPKVVIEGGVLDDTFIDEGGTESSDGDENAIDDTGADGSGEETGGEETGGEETGGEETGGEETGGEETGGEETGGEETGGEGISFAGAYEGVIGRDVATLGDECSEPATLYVDEDNTFFVDGLCSGGWGERKMRFEGVFNDDGEASGRFIGEVYSTEYEAEIDGSIEGGIVDFSADIPYPLESLKAFFYTE